jgi:multimeric flavodoxin WrbA
MGKSLILHDLPENDAKKLLPEDSERYTIFAAAPAVHHCVGCFGCWIKTPSICVMTDRGRDFVALMSDHDEIIVISRMVFGGLSPDVKAMLDRGIGFLLPFFLEVNGEMHHSGRCEKPPDLRYVFYGSDIKDREKETARKLVDANALNFGAERRHISFHPSIQEIREAIE